MIHILYGTDKQYTRNVGDSYPCKSFASAKRELKRIVKKDSLTAGLPTMQKEVLRQFDAWVLDKQTVWSVGSLNIEIGELNILIEEINLI